MKARHIVAIYCRFRYDQEINNMGNYLQTIPEHVLNRIKKAKEVYSRITASHPDCEYTRIIFYGQTAVEPLKQYGKSIGLPEEKIDLDYCKDIATMQNKIWNMVNNDPAPPRVYFVVSNWQWKFLDQLTSMKDGRYKFYFEGTVDERNPNEIEMDKKMERMAKVGLKQSELVGMLDKVGGKLSENLKG